MSEKNTNQSKVPLISTIVVAVLAVAAALTGDGLRAAVGARPARAELVIGKDGPELLAAVFPPPLRCPTASGAQSPI